MVTARSPIGGIELQWDNAAGRLALLTLPRDPNKGRASEFRPQGSVPRPMQLLMDALSRYFQGEPVDFPLQCLDLNSLTPFRSNVSRIVAAIPFGEVMTYGEVAAAAGKPGGAQAVGQVMGANCFPILIPCHRVLAKGGLGGFGAGPAVKKALLRHEGVNWMGA